MYGKGPRSPEHPLCLRISHIDVTTHKLEISKMYLEQWKRLGLRHFILYSAVFESRETRKRIVNEERLLKVAP